MNAPNEFTYRDVQAAWECPRAWGYQRQGYMPYVQPPAMVRGGFTHAGIAAALKGGTVRDGIAAAAADRIDVLAKGKLSNEEANATRELAKEAQKLADKYLGTLAVGLETISVEKRIRQVVAGDGGFEPFVIGGTPDHIAKHEGRKVLVELKTGAGDLRVIAHTGQGDFYAWLAGDVDLLYIDVINEDAIVRLSRPPRMAAGLYIANMLKELGRRAQEVDPRDHPKYGWWCGRCWFFEACTARDCHDDEEDILAQTCYLEEV